jgi:ABC-2 type transport system ATP-binding protein
MSEPTIQTSGLKKSFGCVEALRGLDLEVPQGSIYGFLGRNGAGKTTTMKILLGMAHASGGEALVFGRPCGSRADGVEIRRRTGFVSEESSLYPGMRVQQLITFTRSFYPSWRPDLEAKYLRVFELPLKQRVKSLSKGMRTKLALLLALCRGADLLLLDEPTSGLDPAITEEVLRALVRHVAAEEMTVFFSSHQIAEVEQIASAVCIIEQGRTLLQGSLEELKVRYRRLTCVFDAEAPAANFRTPGVERIHREGRVLSVIASRNAEEIASEAKALSAVSVEVAPVGLKDIFLESVQPHAN